MSTVTVTTTPVVLDAGTAYDLSLVNSGSLNIQITVNGGAVGNLFSQILRPGQQVTVYPHGYPVSAFTASGTSSVDVSTGTNPQGDPATEAGQETVAHAAATFLTPATAAATFLTPSTASATFRTVVNHGATAGTTRPAGAGVVEWRGTVAPTNAQTDDLFIDKSTSPATLKRYTGSAFESISGSGGGGTTVVGSPLGVYIPQGWGAHWAAKVAASASALATVAYVGDSRMAGIFTSALRTKSWPALLTAHLQSLHTDGGSGYYSLSLNTVRLAAGQYAGYVTSGDFWALTGTWADAGLTEGPGSQSMLGQSTGATASIGAVIRGRNIRLYYRVDSAPFSWTVDGGTAVNVTPAGGTGITYSQYPITATAGPHTVAITCGTASTGTPVRIWGVSADNGLGIVGNNFAFPGQVSASYSQGFTHGQSMDWSGGSSYPCDLLIYGFDVNDAANSYTLDNFASYVSTALNRVRDYAGAPNVDILVVGQQVQNTVAGFEPYQTGYLQRLRVVAEHFGAAYVNFDALLHNSWQYSNSLGYWSNGTAGGVTGTDPIHMGDTGNAAMKTLIETAVPALLP